MEGPGLTSFRFMQFADSENDIKKQKAKLLPNHLLNLSMISFILEYSQLVSSNIYFSFNR